MFRPRDRPVPGTTDEGARPPLTTPDAEGRVPAGARLADGVTLTLLALSLRIAIVGPMRFHIGDLRITASSQLRVLLFIAIVTMARHLRWRRPTLPSRVWGAVRRWWSEPNALGVPASAALSRAAVLVVGLVAVSAFGLPPRMPRITDDPVRNIVARWDAFWYWNVLDKGYQWTPDGAQHNVVFFPAFPMAMGAMSAVLRWHPLHAGLLLSVSAFLVATVFLYRLARESLDAEQALAAVWLLAAYPFSVYYSAPYTESLYLLAVLATLYYFGRDRWRWAALWGVVAGLSRPNGCFLSAVLAILVLGEMWRARRDGRAAVTRRAVTQLAVASAPGLGMVAFSAYLYARFGVPLLWTHAQGAWGRTYTSVVDLTATRATNLRESGLVSYLFSQPYEVMNSGAAVFGILMIVPVWRRLGPAYAAFVALSLIPPLVMGGTTSLARVTSTLFPIFIVLSAWCNPARRMALLAVFATLQGLVAALFFTWRPLF